ncbi:MAG TPA: hypothetical protein VLG67_01835 [Candidatus Saccharimonadales bacterium]|nr:hypothetical protein [Candidatus Saccharimonadales bacterium]
MKQKLSFKPSDSMDKKIVELFNYGLRNLQPKKHLFPFLRSRDLETHTEHGDWILTFTKRHNLPARIHLFASTKNSNRKRAEYDTLEAAVKIQTDDNMALEFVEYFHFYAAKSRIGFSKNKFDVDSARGDDPDAATLLCKILKL